MPGPDYEITRDKFLTGDEIKALLKTCQDMADLDMLKGRMTWPTRHMLVALALRSGMRVSEIAALKIGDIHLAGRECRLVVRKSKRKKKPRDVYFNGNLAAPIKSYVSLKQTWDEPAGPDDFLLTHSGGKPFTTAALWYSFKQALRAAGLSTAHTIHHCRHSYATHLLHDTGNLRMVQKQLGHSSIGMTALYADVLPEHSQELADKLSI